MTSKPHPAAGVRLLVLDVDGVMTDGSIMLDDRGVETKRFNVRDGFAIKLWQKLGFTCAIITGRSGSAAKHRAIELGIEHLVQGSSHKGRALQELLRELGLEATQAAFLGDDWPDLPAMRVAGYPMAVADAEPDVRAIARFVTTRPGGRGAVREAVEHLLSAAGLMERARSLYDGHGG